jgi:hypothetical protein
VRVAVAAALVGGVGLFMGLALPLGMRVASESAPRMIPWLWAVNGAASVFASVLAAAVALAWGIAVCYWCGVACYFLAMMALALTRQGPVVRVEPAEEPGVSEPVVSGTVATSSCP